jgi:hypothetical protein
MPKDLPKGLDGTQSIPNRSSTVDPRRDVNGLLAAAKDLRTAGNTQEALQPSSRPIWSLQTTRP